MREHAREPRSLERAHGGGALAGAGLNHEQLPRRAGARNQRPTWIARTLEHAHEEHDVELPDRLRSQIEHVKLRALHPRRQRLARALERVFATRAPPRAALDRQYPRRAEALGREGEVTVARTNVEDALAGEVRETQRAQPLELAPPVAPGGETRR